MNRILIAEDEPRIAAFIEKGLRSHGFTTSVAVDARSATEMALGSAFDLMILDLGLPGKDGLDVLEEIRGQGENFPVIILTARDDIQDKVAGFEAGADDYITKPFRFEELLVRVKARLRNSFSSQANDEMVLKVGNVVLDLRSRKVKVDNKTLELPAREFTLAETFFRHPGQVLSREQLLDRVWGYDYDPGSNIVDVYVGYLRKKLGNHLIETVRGMGYRLRT
ncbi:response regulator transcription factor [Nostoc spongiaeforme FACHB-130]|uniref:Response regulator transcription factor n=1 Tax=Nostoc spongiaeforme FACHB-130 TaxID=1357510 RepID=A0ABR8FRS0_9NOSO|nr:response regulator transcription factor [Nostoc spongiaeforme]MBD2593844.1 response regulator transcription factor [Nostoc spongiaeforme FACHB-130]